MLWRQALSPLSYGRVSLLLGDDGRDRLFWRVFGVCAAQAEAVGSRIPCISPALALGAALQPRHLSRLVPLAVRAALSAVSTVART